VTLRLPPIARHLETSRPRNNSRPATWITLVTLSLAAFLLRTPQLDVQSLWRDEVDVIRLAVQPLPQLIRGMTQVGHNGPLYYLLMRGWLGLAGDSEFALRYFALCFGILSVPLIYQAGKLLAGQRAGLLVQPGCQNVRLGDGVDPARHHGPV
jgi:4-amino-4-deoxy-L-arabinose transferase-like glycosyltransferase